MSETLAIRGGSPVLRSPFLPANTFGRAERKAVIRVLKSGKLSEFVGAPGKFFLGGTEVKRFERAVEDMYGVENAVSFNSATTALHAAISALGIGPGDEVIVSPYTMSASATAVLMNGAVPVFADIDDSTFCLDPESVKKRITRRTKAIMAVNIFGQPADLGALKALCDEFNLKLIEDNAQAPGALFRGQPTGTIGDIGVFSLNVHKVINCGEGGVLVTNSKDYAYRAQLARNHGEVVVDALGQNDQVVLGSNYRMSELHAAVAYEQMKKLNFLNERRVELANYLTSQLHDIRGLITPAVREGCSHVYYVYGLRFTDEFAMPRDTFVDAMGAEGFPMSKGYVKPIHLMQIFQQRKVFNQTHFPFEAPYYDGKPDYEIGSCPVAERMYSREFAFTAICYHPRTKRDIDLFVRAVKKVLSGKDQLL